MHRNTFLFVSILAVFAALVVGVNIGKRMTRLPEVSVTPTIAPTPTTVSPLIYRNEVCGISLAYPSTMTKLENASGSAVFTDPEASTSAVLLTCQKDIPRIPLPLNRIETMVLFDETKTASVATRLYHDASLKDGTPVDKLIFHNPKTGVDVFLAGFGSVFEQIISSIRIL